MSVGGPNSVTISRQSARQVVALALVLLSVTVAGAALGGVTAAESQSSPIEVSDWTDLDDIRNDLDADYVLVNDLNKSTAGYNAVVLNQTATEFTESVRFDVGESRVNLTRTPVAELLSNDEGLNLTVVDSANGTVKRENTSSLSFASVSYTTPTERFVGFSPIGPSFSERFTGSFDGQGNTIRDLLVARPTGLYIGLFGSSEGTIEQVTATNATITGSFFVGGVVGSNDGTVSTSSASGAVTGTSDQVGGLVGTNDGTVSNSSASGAVNGSDEVGGLVGDNEGTVSNSSASGAVTGSEEVGGLVGANIFPGTVSTSSASGAVTATGDFSDVGGLVGQNDGTVSNSSASGNVTGSLRVGGLVGDNIFAGTVSTSSASGAVNGSEMVGGLVGDNNGPVSTSSASGAVNGSFSVGGLVGTNTRGTVSTSSASGAVTGSRFVGGLVGANINATVSTSSASGSVNGSDDVGGLVGHNNGGTVSESFATGTVTGSTNVGGLVGQLEFLDPGEEQILRDSYYDTQTTGQQAAVGTIVEADGAAELRGEVVGLPTSQMQGASAAQNMGALNFTNTWQIVTDPAGYPELQAGPPPAAEIGPDIEDTDSDGDSGDGENGDTDGDDSDAGDDGGSDVGGSDDDGDGGNGDGGNGGNDDGGNGGNGDGGNGGNGDGGNGGNGDGGNGGNGDGGNGGNGDGGNGGDGFGPGFGPGVVLAGLSGAGYLLKRRGTTTDTDAE